MQSLSVLKQVVHIVTMGFKGLRPLEMWPNAETYLPNYKSRIPKDHILVFYCLSLVYLTMLSIAKMYIYILLLHLIDTWGYNLILHDILTHFKCLHYLEQYRFLLRHFSVINYNQTTRQHRLPKPRSKLGVQNYRITVIVVLSKYLYTSRSVRLRSFFKCASTEGTRTSSSWRSDRCAARFGNTAFVIRFKRPKNT
jgi:hypothetical protein